MERSVAVGQSLGTLSGARVGCWRKGRKKTWIRRAEAVGMAVHERDCVKAVCSRLALDAQNDTWVDVSGETDVQLWLPAVRD